MFHHIRRRRNRRFELELFSLPYQHNAEYLQEVRQYFFRLRADKREQLRELCRRIIHRAAFLLTCL